MLYDSYGENGELIYPGINITKKIDDFMIGIFYVCPYGNCTFETKEFKDLIYDEFNLILSYNSKLIDNDNPDSPVQDIMLNFTFSFYFDDKFCEIRPKWEVYNYEEKKGVISRMIDKIKGKPDDYSFGQITDYEYKDFSKIIKDIRCDKHGKDCIKLALILEIYNDFEGIHFYKRSSVSI